MAIVYSDKVEIRGKAAEPVVEEILFQTNTISEGLVRFETEVKAGTIFTENMNTVNFQAYTCGEPSASGSIGLDDTEITPVKIMAYDEFCYDDLRSTRFNRDMAAGAWNTISDEFTRLVLSSVSKKIAVKAESDFWGGISAASLAIIEGGGSPGPSAAEIAAAGDLSTALYDGVVARLIYNKDKGEFASTIVVNGATGGVTSSNIAGEYAKLYAKIPAEVLQGDSGEMPMIYAPKKHMQLINIYNSAATYRDLFSVQNGQYFYNNVRIVFVPVPDSVMIAALPGHIIWATDLPSDISTLVVDKIANNRDDFFYKAVFTSYAHVVNQDKNVLYVAGV